MRRMLRAVGTSVARAIPSGWISNPWKPSNRRHERRAEPSHPARCCLLAIPNAAQVASRSASPAWRVAADDAMGMGCGTSAASITRRLLVRRQSSGGEPINLATYCASGRAVMHAVARARRCSIPDGPKRTQASSPSPCRCVLAVPSAWHNGSVRPGFDQRLS